MPKRKSKSPAQLPQRDDIWYVDTERMRTWAENDDGDLFRPQLVLIINGNTGAVMHTNMQETPLEDADILRELTNTMLGSGQLVKGDAHRPGQVYMQPELASEWLLDELGKLDIQVRTVERPEEIQEMLVQMAGVMFEDDETEVPALLAVEGVTPELVGGVFAAAAAYYRATPWY
ncbi:MAG: hypothetical protein KDE54_31195, partial [Caldilineaceae bacterium]|nr:hypothetical protein [Caldilineaceae bacterium]